MVIMSICLVSVSVHKIPLQSRAAFSPLEHHRSGGSGCFIRQNTMHRLLKAITPLHSSSLSLPSLPEHGVYIPNKNPLIAFFEKRLGSEKSRKAAMGVTFLITAVLLFSCALLLQQNDIRRRLSLRRASRTLLFDDGTLYTNQRGNDSPCDYLTNTSKRHTDVKFIHINFEEFEMQDYLGAKLIANAAQVPLILSGNLKEAAALYDNAAYRVGPIPTDHGKKWPAKQLCQRCTMPLCQDYIHLLHHTGGVAAKEDVRFNR